MFIHFKDYLSGASVDSLLDKQRKFYNDAISNCMKNIARLKLSIEEKKSPLHNLLSIPFDYFTEQDKKYLYNAYVNYHDKIAALSSNSNIKSIPAYKDCSYSTLFEYYNFLLKAINANSEMIQLQQYDKQLGKLLREKNNVVMLNVTREDLFKNFELFKKLCTTLSFLKSMNIVVAISNPMITKSNNSKADYVFSDDEIKKLKHLNEYLKSIGMEQNIRINEVFDIDTESQYQESWDLESVIGANEYIDSLVKRIKDNNLTPYETMAFIHKYITRHFKYTNGSVNKKNNIMGMFIDGTIVCSGYSSFTKAIIDKLNDPNLSCEFLTCHLYGKSKLFSQYKGSHSQCLIHIKDPKYNVEGAYINDACWDAKTDEFPDGRGFAHFLYPVSDVMHIYDCVYEQNSKANRYEALIIDLSKVEQEKAIGNNFLKRLKQLAKLKSKKYRPEVVIKYGSSSKPIPYETLTKVLYAIVEKTKFAGDQIAMDDWVKNQLELSENSAIGTFEKTASNAIIELAIKRKRVFKKSKNVLHDNDNGHSK